MQIWTRDGAGMIGYSLNGGQVAQAVASTLGRHQLRHLLSVTGCTGAPALLCFGLGLVPSKGLHPAQHALPQLQPATTAKLSLKSQSIEQLCKGLNAPSMRTLRIKL